MKLGEMSILRLQEALDIYRRFAYGSTPCDRFPSLPVPVDGFVDQALDCFEDETPRVEGHSRRFILRLGNVSYAFMKLVLEEHLIRGEFCLSVDTHDQMFRDLGADQQELEKLRQINARIKKEIEVEWRERGLPTLEHLKELVEASAEPTLPSRGQRVLVVDDTRVAAETLCLLLETRGFETEWVADGLKALERADPTRHDLILMDVEMPRLDGLEACRRLKADPARSSIPVILATAGRLDLRSAQLADAFLTKPFQLEILYSFIDHLLSPRRPQEE